MKEKVIYTRKRIFHLNTQAKLGAAVLAALLLSACASEPRQGMYWGNYENSLYNLADNPTDRIQQRHLDNLRNIVNVSDSRGWRTPPGVMLELAMYERELGNQGEYTYLVNREFQQYPESQVFIQRWFADVVLMPRQSEDNDEPTTNDTTQTPASNAGGTP